MKRFYTSSLAIAAILAATGARAAELEIPPPGKPKELSVYVNQPHCTRWTDECVSCTRGADGKGPACSNIGFACQPKAIRCIGADIPQSEPDKK
ncbi:MULTISPECIES: hypothetical protein [unclassified Afipia]|uniref:hypothetical protein n=1 Tax=unclassified Afipia TaxID=2642050 RepID=UPI000428FC17|nr:MULTISPECIES: hypothetical protein [unclassified Afipia]